jgi:hypothetical protein
MSSGLKGYLCLCRGSQLRLNLNGSYILVVVVVVKDFIVCFLIVSKQALSPKIFRNFSIFMHVCIFYFQACYRKNAWYFCYKGLCTINNTQKHYTEIISCTFCVPCPCINP